MDYRWLIAASGSLNPAYLKAARSLGASEWRVFWRIVLPLAWRAILVAAAIVTTISLLAFLAIRI